MALERQERISVIGSSPDPLRLYLTTLSSFRFNRKKNKCVLKMFTQPHAHFEILV